MREFNERHKVAVGGGNAWDPLHLHRSQGVTHWLERINTDPSFRYLRSPQDLFFSIKYPKHYETFKDVLGAIMGPPSPRDLNLVELGVSG